MKNAMIVVALTLAGGCAFGITTNTQLQDIPGTATVGEIVDAGSGGVDTNTVIDIIHATVDGAARPLPRYLHARAFDDTYPDAAADYYAQRQGGGAVPAPQCSAVRSGGFLCRNFDYPFDDRAEFVVKMSAGAGRFASVGVAQVGTNLTEEIVTSGKHSRWYKALPGATVDGINERGVVAEINVVDGDPQTSGWHTDGDIHPLAAVRWALDNGTSAGMVASNLALRIAFPQGWSQNFHYMIADAKETWIVENGTPYPILGRPVMTNFRIAVEPPDGPGVERYNLLMNPASSITNAWYTRAYHRETNPPWVSDLADVLAYTNKIFNEWAAHPKEYFRNQLNGGQPWWQTVHTSIYDITNRVLRVCVQEQDDWYTFAVPSAGGIDEGAVREIVQPMIEVATSNKADRAELDGYLPLSGGVSMTGGFSTPEIYVSGKPHPYGYRMPGLKMRAYEESATDSVEIGYAGGNVVLHNPELESYPFPSGTKIPVRADATVALRSDIAYSEERMMAYASQKADNRLIVTNQYGDRIGWNLTYPRVLNLPADTRIGSNGQPSVSMSPYAITVWTNGIYASPPNYYYSFPKRSGYIAIKEEVDEAIESLAREVEQGGAEIMSDLANRYPRVDGLGFDPDPSYRMPRMTMITTNPGEFYYTSYIQPSYIEMSKLVMTNNWLGPLTNRLTFAFDGLVLRDSAHGERMVRWPYGADGMTTFATLADISPSSETFSNAVLAVGLSIDTNSVAALNEIAATFGGFPITGTATTVGGLLAALAAAVALLRKRAVHLDNSGFGDNEFASDIVLKSGALTAGDVVPVSDPSLTKTIATIGGKDIKAPEGGGVADTHYPIADATALPDESEGEGETFVQYKCWQLADETINNLRLDETNVPTGYAVKIYLPDALAPVAGKPVARDLILRLDVANEVAIVPSVTFTARDTGGVGFEAQNESWGTVAIGVSYFAFSESAANEEETE